MYTLHFPITLPAEHTFFDNGQYPVPPLPNGLALSCSSLDGGPLLLTITGFPAKQAALDFCPVLCQALRLAALNTEHSLLLPEGAPVAAIEKLFNGSVPTVTMTKINAQPYHATSSMQSGLHISILVKRISEALGSGAAQKAATVPGLALAMQLYAECQFAGGQNSQFIVLMTALEILVPGAGSKRNAVLGLVRDALKSAGHPNPKAARKALDDLYVARNALLHEAQPVSANQLASLKTTVRDTLKAILA